MLARIAQAQAVRTTALAAIKSHRRIAIVTGLWGLAIMGAAVATSFVPSLLLTGAGCFIASLLSVSSVRRNRRYAAAVENPKLPESILARVGRLKSPIHPNVHWRLERALNAQLHLHAFLRHVERRQPVSWASALAEDAKSCVEHLVGRCEALIDLYAIPIASPSVQTSIAAIENQVDAHLVELSEAMDATATYIALGTRDAAMALQVRAENLQALAAGLHEVFWAESAEPHPAPGAVALALPPANATAPREASS